VPCSYLIGIDLGTTNSVVAYIDTRTVADVCSPVHVFPVPQLVERGEVCTLPTLPSFLYFPTEDELSVGAVSATWESGKEAASLPLPPLRTGLDGFHHPAQAVCKLCRGQNR
jgi:molecular chaperone DnaK (HSP70)